MRYIIAIGLAILATVGMSIFYNWLFISEDLAAVFSLITGLLLGGLAVSAADDW